MKNIVDILKNCPQGTKLYSPIFGEVELEKVCYTSIIVKGKSGVMADFYVDGRYHSTGECMLFPSKENRDWNTFSPFKEGDILYIDCNDDEDTNEQNQYIFILKQISGDNIYSYCHVNGANEAKLEECWLARMDDIKYGPRFATEEEKEKIFKAIKNNNYRWNTETKTLENLIVPKFNVGDKIVNRNSISNFWIVSSVSSEYYGLKLPNGRESIGVLPISEQYSYELVPNKFDITTLKPFDKVLVRTQNFTPVWTIAFYDGYNPNRVGSFRPFGVSNGEYFQQCIPYEGNEHLRGTTDECDEYFKNW